MGAPWRTTEVYWAYLLPLWHAGTKTACCWLSAVRSQSCCVQTCRLLSVADFPDAVVGHSEARRRKSRTIHHYLETQKYTLWMQPHCKGRFDLLRPPHLWPSLCVSVLMCLQVFLTLCVSCRQTGGHEICSTCIRVNQLSLAPQSTTPLGSWSERLGRRDSCVVDTQTMPTTYPLFSKASRRQPARTHRHTPLISKL